MRILSTLSLLAVCAATSVAQTDRVDLTADKLVRAPDVLRGTGHARAKAGALVLQAEEATLHTDTGTLEMRGHVHVTLPARDDHTAIRYGTAVLVTDQPVGLTADRATLKDGLLRCSGGIVLVPVDPDLNDVRLRGDEFWMYLRIADATLRGNVRPNGIVAPAVRTRGIFVPPTGFPPEIIK